jgi:hypothetical protein
MTGIYVPRRVLKSWLKSQDDDFIKVLYNHLVKTDEYLSYGNAQRPDSRLRRVEDELRRRGLM